MCKLWPERLGTVQDLIPTGWSWPGSPVSLCGMPRWHEPTEGETAAAIAELREIAGDRPDLLAEQAGILLGFHEGGLDEPRAKAAASFCIAAGADQGLIPRWVKVGRERAELPGRPPFSRPGRPPRRP